MKRLIDIALRLILIAAFLSNAVIPSIDVLAAQLAKSPTVEQPKAAADGRTLPEQEPIYYQPPATPNRPVRSALDNVSSPKQIPANKPNFSISAQPSVVNLNDSLVLTVILKNPGRNTKTGVLFSDTLKKGFEFVADPGSPVVYDEATRVISYAIGTVDPESSLTFFYKLKITAQKALKTSGEIRVHKVKLTDSSGANKKAHVTIGVSGSLVGAGTDIAVVSPNGGWNDLGKISVYADKNAIGPNTILTVNRLTVTKAPVKAKSLEPETQYQLGMLQTAAISTDDQGDPDEQSLEIQGNQDTAFSEPVTLSFDLTGNIDLSAIPAGEEVYVATYDDANGVWVKMPILEKDLEANTVSVQAAHFSTWGVGLGTSLPQNGANVLLFNQPYTSLFNGSAQYSVPIWTPQGRNGMTPSLALS